MIHKMELLNRFITLGWTEIIYPYKVEIWYKIIFIIFLIQFIFPSKVVDLGEIFIICLI